MRARKAWSVDAVQCPISAVHPLIENIHRSPHSVSAEELSGEIGHHGHLRFREQIGCGAVIMSCGQVRPENVPRIGTLRQGREEAPV